MKRYKAYAKKDKSVMCVGEIGETFPTIKAAEEAARSEFSSAGVFGGGWEIQILEVSETGFPVRVAKRFFTK